MADEQPGTDVQLASPGGKRDKAWWDAHPEERLKQSERAKALIEQGKLSGKAGYGRRKRRPAYEITAAKAAVNGAKIADELIRQALNVDSEGKIGKGDVPITQRQNAIKLLFEAEHKVRSERREEEDHLARLAGDELTSELFSILRELTGMDEFDTPDYDFDGEAEEVEESVGGYEAPVSQ
jgi:hypothetical protein